VLGAFELHGYERVTLPVFEYASVLERGMGSLDAAEVLRFVEPESGEVVALRPDMTPQIARLVATRLADAPGPARLCYDGSVLRRRRERARRQRQVPQAGIELIGSEGPRGDLEVLSVAIASARAAGLERYTVDLSHARVAASLIEGAPRAAFAELAEALALRDAAELSRRAARVGLPADTARALTELCELRGEGELWPRAERALRGTAAEAPLRELRELWEVVAARGEAPALSVDLGEVWNFAYYTGPMFQLFAAGPGAAVGSGGRYDGLLGRFGAPRPAAGFAIDLDHLRWALAVSGAERQQRARILVRGAPGATEGVLGALRGAGTIAAPSAHGAEEALAYARAWRYTHLVDCGRPALIDVVSGSAEPLPSERSELAQSVLGRLRSSG
jgi:ATP phosphoribosyltransferase regulatory subunit